MPGGGSRSPGGSARSAADGPREQKFWVNTVSLDHVRLAERGGFTQADHGANTRLRWLQAGDGLVFYSPRTELGPGGSPVQEFTAIGEITGDAPYPVTLDGDDAPLWRLAMRFAPCTPVAAKPLAPELSFVADPARWGYPFRRGLFPIPESDFRTLARALGAESAFAAPTPTPAAGG